MKKLLIVESPSKIKTISKFLGADFRIMSTMGHIKDLPSKKIGVTMGTPIEIEYVVLDGKEKVIADICKTARSCDEIYLAPDPDREGEIIAWHIGQEVEKVAKEGAIIHRISFNEITKPAIVEAISHTSTVDMEKVSAQQARRVLDRWVGYEVSPILWRKVTRGLSAGRVQSVALRLICDREDSIRAFTAEEYWSIEGLFKQGVAGLSAMLDKISKKAFKITSEAEAKKIDAEIKKTDFIIDSITDKKRVKRPLPPFMTSTIQQAAYNRLGFSVKKTMQIAQKLYEGMPLDDKSTPIALITYMRTDSLRLSETALKQGRSYIKANFGAEYLPATANVFSKKSKEKAQDAHEAIRPINAGVSPQKVARHLPPDAAKLYKLIWERFISSQMTPAQYAQRQVLITGGKFTFKATGSTLVFDGFLRVYKADEEEKDQKTIIPKELTVQNPIDLSKTVPKQHFTQPPPRFTEASLVKEMEKEGIGRPSTYVAILNTIQARNYTSLDEKKRFVPTELGMQVTKILVENLPNIMDLKFTANMEQDLDKIAEGDLKRDKLLKDFYAGFEKDLAAFRGTDVKRVAQETNVTCPECNASKLAIRFGKAGEFLGCTGYPECAFTSNFERAEDGELKLVKAEAPKLLEEKCPNCAKPLREVVGRFGPFVACSGYPDCKYIHQEIAGFACPQCEGPIGKRSWRGKTFWGCKAYPKCKFAIFSDIEEKACRACKSPYHLKREDKAGKVTLSCPECTKKDVKKTKPAAKKTTKSK